MVYRQLLEWRMQPY